MRTRLTICTSCRRHVRETVCPFCGGDAPPREPAFQRRLLARKLLAASVLLSACSSSTSSTVGDAQADTTTTSTDAGEVSTPVVDTAGCTMAPDQGAPCRTNDDCCHSQFNWVICSASDAEGVGACSYVGCYGAPPPRTIA